MKKPTPKKPATVRTTHNHERWITCTNCQHEYNLWDFGYECPICQHKNN